MSLFKKDKKVPPLTFEEEMWLRDDNTLKEMEQERRMFSDDETYRDFCNWRYSIKKKDWSYKPMGTGRPGPFGEEWINWVSEYYAEHPDAKIPKP